MEPIPFTVTGDLAGANPRCTGSMTLTGVFLPTATCVQAYSFGTISGVPGVGYDFGYGATWYVRGVLYGEDGATIVGGYNAQVLTSGTTEAVNACGSDEGYTGGPTSTVVELYPS